MSGLVKGIDLSEHNGVVDWDQVKSSGVGFDLLRARQLQANYNS